MPDSQENTVSRRYGIPLSALSTSQIDAIRRIPRHQDARPPSLLERRSVEIFLSDEYWKL